MEGKGRIGKGGDEEEEEKEEKAGYRKKKMRGGEGNDVMVRDITTTE